MIQSCKFRLDFFLENWNFSLEKKLCSIQCTVRIQDQLYEHEQLTVTRGIQKGGDANRMNKLFLALNVFFSTRITAMHHNNLYIKHKNFNPLQRANDCFSILWSVEIKLKDMYWTLKSIANIYYFIIVVGIESCRFVYIDNKWFTFLFAIYVSFHVLELLD